jgi:hypothetical protein
VKWPKIPFGKDNRFYLNGNAEFINGIAEYEHQIGNSHAFTPEEIKSRVSLIQQAGFNAFRDAHQPHNLLYGDLMDEKGMLWWTQFSAHIWFDNPVFRENFKALLRDWVKERRNNPSVVMWGLQNESRLPKDFAEECTQIIRDMDPTTSSQRLVTTCNGGDGTDWDVPQNWTGTYGGNPANYGEDLKRQVLVGEYGSWRSLDLHVEDAYDKNTIYSEDRMVQLMEQKVRLADSVKNETSGHFFWLYNSHDNPGRVQGGEGYREADGIGPVNYKGLFTSWGEPTDVYQMFKSNYTSQSNPMIYIVSHTWPNRWLTPGIKNEISVYSNCDEVELFNDLSSVSLGKKKKLGIGTHFTWYDVNIQYNVLYAVGYIKGKAVVKDSIVLNHLPLSPHFQKLYQDGNILKAQDNYHYLYRVNCGGNTYTDIHQQLWQADIQMKSKDTWGSSSWSAAYADMPAYFASQRRIFDPIKQTKDWPLFQQFRYGKDDLSYSFPVKNGEYLVELYFVEPWLGLGDLSNHNNQRLINVAINDRVYIRNLDIWKESGTLTALKKSILVKVENGKILIHFPQTTAGQALISAIAIASKDQNAFSALPAKAIISPVDGAELVEWLDIGNQVYIDSAIRFSMLPPKLFQASFLKANYAKKTSSKIQFEEAADIYIAIRDFKDKPQWLNDFENTQTTLQTDEAGAKTFTIFKKRFHNPKTLEITNKEMLQYLVFATPVNTLEPAYDLKMQLSFKPDAAEYSKELQLETLIEKPSLTFKSADKGHLLWNFQTGVADMYSLTLRYSNRTGKMAKVKIELFAQDGTLMHTVFANLSESFEGKWAYFTTNTGTMINAGSYKLKISNTNAQDISISQLLVQ